MEATESTFEMNMAKLQYEQEHLTDNAKRDVSSDY